MGTHLYWRWRGFGAASGGNGSIAAASVEFRGTPGGANLATGGTPTASSVFSTFGPANAFDGNSSTVFSSNSGGSEQWIQYQFPSAVEINEVYWLLNSGLNGAHAWMDMWSSDDGVNWTLEWRHSLMADWVSGEARTFTRPAFPYFTPRLCWRLLCRTSISSSIAALSEVEFRATPGGATQTTGGTVIKDSEFSAIAEAAINAFDGNINTLWASANTGVPHWIGYVRSSGPFYCQEYRVVSRNDGAWSSQTPQWLILQSCDDQKTWTDEHEIIAAWSSAGQSQLVQTPIYTTSDIAIANAAIETMLGLGSNIKLGIANAAIETIMGLGSDREADLANVAIESVVGPPVSQLWLANVAIETVIKPMPDIFPMGQIIGG